MDLLMHQQQTQRRKRKYHSRSLYLKEKKACQTFLARHNDHQTTASYLNFLENHVSKHHDTCTLYIFEQFLFAIEFAMNYYTTDNTLQLFQKADNMFAYLIDTNRMGSNTLIQQYIVLMRKCNMIKSPTEIYKTMTDLKIEKTSFKVAASLLTTYTTYSVKSQNENFMIYAEQSFLRMLNDFKYVQIYLYNAMLNMFYKLQHSKRVWGLYKIMIWNNVKFTPYTYGSLLETCLYIDKNWEFGMKLFERFKMEMYDENEKHYKYVDSLGVKIKEVKNDHDEEGSEEDEGEDDVVVKGNGGNNKSKMYYTYNKGKKKNYSPIIEYVKLVKSYNEKKNVNSTYNGSSSSNNNVQMMYSYNGNNNNVYYNSKHVYSSNGNNNNNNVIRYKYNNMEEKYGEYNNVNRSNGNVNDVNGVSDGGKGREIVDCVGSVVKNIYFGDDEEYEEEGERLIEKSIKEMEGSNDNGKKESNDGTSGDGEKVDEKKKEKLNLLFQLL